jgi:hypothetical protein
LDTGFTLLKEGTPIFSGKKVDGSHVLIGEGAEFHRRSTAPVAVVRIGRRARRFVMTGPADTVEVMRVVYTLPGGRNTPRDVCVTFADPPAGIPRELTNRKARVTKDHRWVVDFNARTALKSIKNVVMVDSDDRVIILVVKLDHDTLGVEVRQELSIPALFCFGVSCFLCNL